MKEWFQQDRWLGTFLIAFGAAMVIALILLWFARSSYEEAFARFEQAALEKSRLERLDPFPNEANYRNMQNLIGVYNLALEAFKKQIQAHVLPEPQLAPNEFQ